MNNTIRPIFNEKIVKKWSLWVSCTMHETYLYCWNVHCTLKKNQQLRAKKKGENAKCECVKREFKPHLSISLEFFSKEEKKKKYAFGRLKASLFGMSPAKWIFYFIIFFWVKVADCWMNRPTTYVGPILMFLLKMPNRLFYFTFLLSYLKQKIN